MLQKSFFLFCSVLLSLMLQINAAEETAKPAVPISTTIKETKAPTSATPVVAPVISAPSSQPPKAPFEPFTGNVVGAKVRMRTSPTLESHVVRETLNGELFAVVGEVNEYYAVTAPKGIKGYVFRTFVLDGIVEGERVNVRLSPDIEAPVIAQLSSGVKVATAVCDANQKWLAIDLPESCRFYIAKEYIEKKGGIDLIAQLEKKKSEGSHHLSAAAFFAQAEIQKPFEQIDFDKISDKFNLILKNYQEFPAISDQIKEALQIFQDIYVQKKVAFLEGRSEHKAISNEIDPAALKKLAKLGIEMKSSSFDEKHLVGAASAAAKVIGLSSPMGNEAMTDKMMAWQPLEESLYHLWAASNSEKTIDEFYAEEKENAAILSGIIEPYTRPVKNRPGDFVLRSENLPVAFLYSTRINLEKHVGQKVTLIAAPRPNHNFAFPAYYVITIE